MDQWPHSRRQAIGWTSHDAVSKLRWLARTRKVGHLGTLDPAATGAAPLIISRVTRLVGGERARLRRAG